MSKFFAVISGSVVTNVIVADSREDAELVSNSLCVEYTSSSPAEVGWSYDAETNTFTAPAAEESATEEPSV